MNKYSLQKFSINNKDHIKIYSTKKIFLPNLTTALLIEGCKKIIKKKNKVLDLGCGSGVIGNYLFKNKLINKIYASDISKNAVNCAIYNANKVSADYEIKKSNMLNVWNGQKFNIIINDISGISTKINKLTNWYKYADNQSGVDGIKFNMQILKKYKSFLKKNGYLIFPIIGLSNRDKLIKFITKNKIQYKILAEKDWPLPRELYKYKKILYKLKNKKIINFEEKFGLLTTKTEIICCK